LLLGLDLLGIKNEILKKSLSFSGFHRHGGVTTRKNIFNGGLFLHYPGLKPLLSSLLGVSISPAKPSLENVLARVFTNPGKHQSITEVFYPLVFNIGFKTSVKFYGFKTPG